MKRYRSLAATSLRQFLLAAFVAGACGAGGAWAADPFTVALIPDTQYYVSASRIHYFTNQTQWIIDNRLPTNIVMASHLGDCVNSGSSLTEWSYADMAMDILDTEPALPYGVVLGNHDYAGSYDVNSDAGNFLNYFGAARFAGRTWYGDDSVDGRNQYHYFQGGGRDYLHLVIEWHGASAANDNAADVIQWARDVLENHPTVPTILSTHEYLGTSGGRTAAGEDIFNALVYDYPQVFMVLCGHVPGEAHSIVQNAAGQDVFQILADFQGRANGGDGWMTLLSFVPDAAVINVRTYSPSLGQYETDANSQYSLPLDFTTRFDFGSGPFMGTPLATAITKDGATLSSRLVHADADQVTVVWAYDDLGPTDVTTWQDAPGGGLHRFGSIGVGTATSHAVTGLDTDTMYHFAFVAAAGGATNWSTVRAFVTDLTDESAPAFTGAVPFVTSVRLDWQDNASNETSYVLQRSLSADSGPYTYLDVGNTTTYTDSDLVMGTTYFYQLAATNADFGSSTAFMLATTNVTTIPPSLERFVAPGGSDVLNDGLSWSSPFATLEHAVSLNDARTINVSNGTYAITTELVVDWPLTIQAYGHGSPGALENAPRTVIDRGGSGGRVFTLCHPDAVIDGLTITGGSVADYGGGVYMSAGTIRHTIIEGNKSTGNASFYGGGGIYIPSGGSGIVSNCVIRHNTCNTLYRDGGGAGIYAWGGLITHSEVVENTNLIGRAGGIWCNASPVIRNCLIARNKANNNRKGGGIYIRSGSAEIESCTVVSNSVVGVGGGIARSTMGATGTPTVRNCIIYFNTDSDGVAQDFPGATTYATYTCCPDATSSTGNTTADPLFADLASGDYRPAAASPCIDAGTSQIGWMSGARDLAGTSRVLGWAVDIGAFEFVRVRPGSVFIFF